MDDDMFILEGAVMRTTKPLAALLVAISAFGSTSPSKAEVFYRFSKGVLFDGRYGPIAKVQEAAKAALAACGSSDTISVDGKFGPGTRDALAALAKCPVFASQLAADGDAKAGAVTGGYWAALLGTAPAPGVDDRARTLMLTYEATDYTRMEWNFCQSKPLYNPSSGHNKCFSNDPHSYLTWGPNGATGGGGREVQLILQAVDKGDPTLIDESFGAEKDSVRRMFSMPDRDTARSLETYLCGIWVDPARRLSWKDGFDKIGRLPTVRATFDRLYQSSSLDGGKINTFIKAYSANGLAATEVDYAFFKDRAAHTTPKLDPVQAAIATVLASEPDAVRWQVRRSIALNVRPSNQRTDRLGRDVAFYLDGSGLAGLSTEEREAWQGRGRLHASDAGLSDDRPYTSFTAGPPIDTDIAHPTTLSAAERAACPAAVLATQQP
jgi:hypothetical protein